MKGFSVAICRSKCDWQKKAVNGFDAVKSLENATVGDLASLAGYLFEQPILL
jgi:hypothetical protein